MSYSLLSHRVEDTYLSSAISSCVSMCVVGRPRHVWRLKQAVWQACNLRYGGGASCFKEGKHGFPLQGGAEGLG